MMGEYIIYYRDRIVGGIYDLKAISMARTANVFARVEPEVKEQAEQVLDRLGIPMSNAVGMFLRQIVRQRGIPFEMKLPAYEEPVAYGSLTKEQFNAEIEKGMEDIIVEGRKIGINLLSYENYNVDVEG